MPDEVGNSILIKKKNYIFHLGVKKGGSFSSPLEKKSWAASGLLTSPGFSLMAVPALRILGWVVLTTELDVHNCQQDGQAKAASAWRRQHPARCQQLQELEANVDSVMS